MLGLSGAGVFLAYVLMILSALLCIVYGVRNWNRPSDAEVEAEMAEEANWEKEDPEARGEV
ncbi:MAG: hypothetical protein D6B26_00525 [Spirochaetaceae bacterium]|nr:MAG: hypothetical protein D6B26_00525 [Spirochaetaceae bacterium]